MAYTNYPRGSEWRRWDLHIHTPGTKKNDQFAGSDLDNKWSNYIAEINSTADHISVVGITDYFCIENYFRFKENIANGRITKQFDMVIPNIELRIMPVTGSATPINIHCLFNPAIEADIESRFLAKLKFNYNSSDYSAKREELIRLGKALPGNSGLGDSEAHKAGINQYVVQMSDLRTLFEKDATLRENTIIVVSNKSGDGASGLAHENFFTDGSSQLDATRWSIYQFADAIFSSNNGDILYFLGKRADSKEVVIEKCSALMPCFHGCDAHELSKVFRPDVNRFCWIKADPTFEGLKQTLYEPEDRVKIQAMRPEEKNDRNVISELNFIDSGNLFGNQSILLNDNLNAIIGGKSSGKSLLLFAAAQSIDPEQVKNASDRLGFEGYTFDSSFDFEVLWKNGDRDKFSDVAGRKSHKIIYIPQLYINYLVEKNNKEELNALIKNILLQDGAFKEFYDHNIDLKNSINRDADTLLQTYFQTRQKLIDMQTQQKDLGKSDAITASIRGMEAKIAEGQRLSNLTPEEVIQYNGLVQELNQHEKTQRTILEQEAALNKIVAEVEQTRTNLLGKAATQSTYTIKGQIDRILDELSEPSQTLNSLKDSLANDYDILIQNLRLRIQQINIPDQKQRNAAAINAVYQRLAPFASKIAGQKELKTLTDQLQKEQQRLLQAQNLEKQLSSLSQDYTNTRQQIAALLAQRIQRYNEIINSVNTTKSNIGSDIFLQASLRYKAENFALYNQTNKAAIPSEHFFNTLVQNNLVNFSLIPELFSQLLRVYQDKLMIDSTREIPLRQQVKFEDVLRGLVADNIEIDYHVTYKGDDLLKMSPGKKGTVLLILFLQISSSEFPILIDQPEDNLDNRTIYDLLCQMIKSKKRERQIIIVSHNANLVVATDTENVIVANQEGQGSPIGAGRYRFEYVNGSIEHSFAKDTTIPAILKQQGIKEHITDILEGGDEAFKQRERKYNIK